jgi:hypothetical protein
MTESQSTMQESRSKAQKVSIRDHTIPIDTVMATKRCALRREPEVRDE